jgi:hypothetical protein
MRKILFLALTTSVLLYSCVSQTEHEKTIAEKDAIAQERDKLKQELEDIKFGAPNLLADGKKFYEAKDFTQSKQKFQMLVDKHPDMPQSIEAKKYLSNIDEEELWNNASTSEDITISESYINKYPRGKYISKANARRSELKILNMQKAYDAASSQNTSYSWKKFLEEYPNHDEASAIRKRIIRLEVDEISGDRETGQMPAFNQYGSSYSSSSTVQITNNTGCELIVRYSGPDVEMIVIPIGSTRSVNLSSGSYKIAASACGANYAGSESLHGDYGSTFYISTTRY